MSDEIAVTKRRTHNDMIRQRRGLTRDEFLGRQTPVPALSARERTEIVSELIRIIEGLYVHLPLKRAMYGIDPVQQLRRLRDRAAHLEDGAFHAEVAQVVRGLRDAHTIYIGPEAREGVVARLPFLVEQYQDENGELRFMVAKVVEDAVDDPDFVEGVELIYWNGTPIADEVRRHARDERGGRPDSALARAVESLTFRPLGYVPMPLEHWVAITYRDGDDPEREARFVWRLIEPGPGPEPTHPAEATAAAAAIHPDRAVIRRAKKLSFKPRLWATEVADRIGGAVPDTPSQSWMVGRFQDNVSARVVPIDGIEYGYLRLWSFDLVDDDGFIAEVRELLGLLPRRGLMVDLRGNPGGLIWAAERLLQLFTPNWIEPARFSLIASDLSRAMTDAPQNRRSLSPWRRSLADAGSTGDLYSQGIPITPVERCNDIGQVYGGPVVAVVDATTYSAGDLFAAGFADNGVGMVVSIGNATGAGGANVWRSDTLRAFLADTGADLGPLPGGVGFTLAVRRATRVGASEGSPIEDVGVAGHRSYAMTRTDLLGDNQELLAFCARLIDAAPSTDMRASATERSVDVSLDVATVGLSRVDVFANGRPHATVDVEDGDHHFLLPHSVDEIRVDGYRGDNLAQTRRLVDRGGAFM